MSLEPRDVILLAHAAAGMFGTLAALWVFVEALNARAENGRRLRIAARATAAFMSAACLLGGYWYLHFYPADKAIILSGPWPLAHSLFMETKEHLFFATLILALYLPVAAADRIHAGSAARRILLCSALLTAATGIVIEGAGAVVDHGAKIALFKARA